MSMRQVEKTNSKSSLAKDLIDIMITFAVSFIAVFFVVHFIAQPIRVEGASMFPTLESGSLGISNVIGLKLQGLERFDIAIIKVKDDVSGKDKHIVKRVIGLPKDTISYIDDQLYVNGIPTAEEYLDFSNVKDGHLTENIAPFTLQEGEYFCLGDNRQHSKDSRYYGPFQKEQIVCKGVFVLWPLKDFGVKSW